jgi:hypothetical protein
MIKEKNIYERALDRYNSGLFLQLEGSYGRWFVDSFISSGIIKTLNEAGNKVMDGYGREILLKKAEIDYDRVYELETDNYEFIEDLNEQGVFI